MGEHWWYHKFIDIEISRWAAILELWAIEKLVGMRNTRQSGTPISLSLSLSTSHDRGPAINSVVNRFHALLPFTEALSSQDYVSWLLRKQTCYYVLWFDVCISVVVYFDVSLSLSLSCLFAYVPLVEVHQKGMRISETSIAMLGQLAFRSSRHTWI